MNNGDGKICKLWLAAAVVSSYARAAGLRACNGAAFAFFPRYSCAIGGILPAAEPNQKRRLLQALVGVELRLDAFGLYVLFALMQKERKRSRLQKNS